MSHHPKKLSVGLGVVTCSLLVAGCAGGPGSRQTTDYDRLPGSGDRMADGPGLMSPTQDDEYDDGVRLYSNEPSNRALINRGGDSPTAVDSGQQSATAAAQKLQAAPKAVRERKFEEFEEYQRFRNMPKDSAEYRRFENWQEWKQYQQWKDDRSR